MAAIAWVIDEADAGPAAGVAGIRSQFPPGTLVVKWTLANGQTGASFICADYPDRSVVVSGTAGAGFAATVEGSDTPGETEPADAQFITSRDASGNAVAFTTCPAAVQELENFYRLRPKVTAGDGTTAVVVRLALTKTARR